MPMDRRMFIATASAGCAVALSEALAASRSMVTPFFKRHRLQLGMQIFTLINEATADLDGTLQQVARIGFGTIELAGFLRRTPAQLRASLDGAGLDCTSIHIPAVPAQPGAVSLSGDLAALARDVHILGAKTIVMPRYMFAPGADQRRSDESQLDWVRRVGVSMTRQDWERNAIFLNDVGRRLSREGLHFSYHNQNPEFAPLPDGQTGLDVLLRNTDPDIVRFEMDVGWVAMAGLDPVTLLKAYPKRFTQMHVKDVLPLEKVNYAFVQKAAPLGEGQINWEQLIPAAYAAGVRDFFVEHDPPHQGDPMASLMQSYRYLTGLMV